MNMSNWFVSVYSTPEYVNNKELQIELEGGFSMISICLPMASDLMKKFVTLVEIVHQSFELGYGWLVSVAYHSLCQSSKPTWGSQQIYTIS